MLRQTAYIFRNNIFSKECQFLLQYNIHVFLCHQMEKFRMINSLLDKVSSSLYLLYSKSYFTAWYKIKISEMGKLWLCLNMEFVWIHVSLLRKSQKVWDWFNTTEAPFK